MPATHESRNFFLQGPAGCLEAILWTPVRPVRNDAPPMAALVCHPHPLFGGTMHNKVVYQTAKSLDALGLPVLRFNFRGAGTSAGQRDKGDGEQDDVRAALDRVRIVALVGVRDLAPITTSMAVEKCVGGLLRLLQDLERTWGRHNLPEGKIHDGDSL